MKRVFLTALVVMLAAGAAMAQEVQPSLWLKDIDASPDDGTLQAIIGASDTYIELWMGTLDPGNADRIMVGMDSILKGFDSANDPSNLHFSVVGVDDTQTLPGSLELITHGSAVASGDINDYQFVLDDRNLPWGGASGWKMPAADTSFLLDRIQIRGDTETTDPDQVLFAFSAQEPGWTEITQLFGTWTPNDQPFNFGLGAPPGVPGGPNVMLVEVAVPEPASLGLLALGGLAVAARRRRK